MKWLLMSSPTPSIDSGPSTLGSILDEQSGLNNTHMNSTSSSSSTCSSIIFPHLRLTINQQNSLHLVDGKCGTCTDSSNSICQECQDKIHQGNRLNYNGTLDLLKSFETTSTRLQAQYVKAQNEIHEAFGFYRTLLEERKDELLKELETVYATRQLSLNVVRQHIQETLDRMYQALEFGDRLLRDASPPQAHVFRKLLETRLQAISANLPEPSLRLAATVGDLEFIPNFSSMGSTNSLGYIRSGNECIGGICPIGRPNGNAQQQVLEEHEGGMMARRQEEESDEEFSEFRSLSKRCLVRKYETNNGLNHMAIRNNSTHNSFPQLNGFDATYEKWSNGIETFYQNGQKDFVSNGLGDFLSSNNTVCINSNHDNGKLTTPIGPLPKNPGIKRQKMIYHCKFGEFGTAEAQFTEPSGVAVNSNNEIIVADTNNHRIQIFDREGRFKFQFGECGKRDGQLLYPNRVAVMRPSGDIVVTERSPTHQIQIYNQYGQFVRKFGANILQHPRGVTVDSKSRIIVVECKVMRVIIFDQAGSVIHKFGCSKHLEFPNGVVVNDCQEIFISDNRAHCVKVFNYEGHFLRQIGGEGVTNYPIGVGINHHGEILVADNHNNFNITIFTQEGELVSALESKVKHAQCFDVTLINDGSVVLASKDYRLYIYRYIQIPPIGI